MIIAEAMKIDRYDHWSYWFMHECAVHAMKGYWSCMKTVDHSYEQALIMHDNVHIHVIMNIIMTPNIDVKKSFGLSTKWTPYISGNEWESTMGRGKKKLGKSGQADRLGWPPPSPEAVRKMWKIFDFDFRLKILIIYYSKQILPKK